MPSILSPQLVRFWFVELGYRLAEVGYEHSFRELTKLIELLKTRVQFVVELRNVIYGRHIKEIQRAGLKRSIPHMRL